MLCNFAAHTFLFILLLHTKKYMYRFDIYDTKVLYHEKSNEIIAIFPSFPQDLSGTNINLSNF